LSTYAYVHVTALDPWASTLVDFSTRPLKCRLLPRQHSEVTHKNCTE